MTNSFNPDIWVPSTPERELYDIYQRTIESRFDFFGVRTFEEAVGDLSLTLLPYDGSSEISQDLLDMIVTPESFSRFLESLDDYVEKFELRSWLEHRGSLAFVTNHKQFTDVPVTAEALGRIGLAERGKTVQVISKMIAGMTLDLGEGTFVVIDKLRNISTVTQTIPRIDGPHTKELERYRETTNPLGFSVIESALDTTGAIVVESFIGRHDDKSRSGKTVYLHEPNKRTAEALQNPRTKVIPLFVNCETFRSDGRIAPADMDFELRDPLRITKTDRDSALIMDFFKDATKRSAGDSVQNVRVISWRVQQLKNAFISVGANKSADADY